MDRVLPIHPQPHESESLTSWINRVAAANVLSVQSLLSSYLGGEYWRDRDIDLLAPDELAVLSHIGRVEGGQAMLSSMVLTPWMNLISQGNKMDRKGWISSKTSIRYCPLCLSDTSYPRILWRLHFVALCPVHGVSLYNGCWRKGCSSNKESKVRFEQGLHACNLCDSRFSAAPVLKPLGCNRLLHFCSSIVDILNGKIPEEYGWTHEPSEFFAVLLALVRYFNLYMQRESGWTEILANHAIPVVPPFDWRTNNAVACVLFERALGLIENWPINFLDFARHNIVRVKRLCAEYGKHCPGPLKQTLAEIGINPTSTTTQGALSPVMFAVNERNNHQLRYERVRLAVQTLVQSNETISLRKISKMARIHFRSLKSDGTLRNLIDDGRKQLRTQRQTEVQNAITDLHARRVRVTTAAVSSYLGRSYRYFKTSPHLLALEKR